MTVSGHASPAAIDGVTIAFTVIAAIAVFLRLLTRLRIVHNGGIDDIFIVAALIFSVGLAICTCVEVHYGMGKHTATLSEADGLASLKALYASIIVYNLAMFCTKFSILLQYLRIFPQTRFRIACYVLMAIVLAYSTWCFFSSVFSCIPIAAFWDVALLKNGHCMSHAAVWFANAGVNILTDIATAVLPLRYLRQLNVPRRQRVALMIVFGLGGFTCLVSVLRLESVYAASMSKDQSYNVGLTALWSVVEINTGILCSCLPTLKALASRFSPRILTTYQRSQDPSSQYPSKKSKISQDELGRGLSGRGIAVQRSHISRASRHSMDIVMDEMGTSPKDIRVVTVVNQEVEGGLDGLAKSEHGSMRQLVHQESFDGGSGSDTSEVANPT